MMAPGPVDGDLVLVADVHIGRDDPDLPAFLAFLEARAEDTAVLVLLGDIFSLWLGREKYTEEHHRAVLDGCAALRARGTRVVFVEGNREFGAGAWRGRAFDEVTAGFVAETFEGERWYLAHGDLLNRDDRRHWLFHRLVRARIVLGAFGLLPARMGLALSGWLERRMRHRNLRHKTSAPKRRFAGYAEWLARQGYDAGAIGHVHVEMSLDFGDEAGGRRLYVLPDWRSGRRALRIPRSGAPIFEASEPAPPVAPAVVEVAEKGGAVTLRLEPPTSLTGGQRVAISSGHGPEVRRGRVTAAPPDAPIELQLEPGPPVQVGDRLLREDPRP